MDPLFLIQVNCTNCETAFKTSRVRPSFKKAVRSDTDFCAYFKEINPDYYVVRVCPYCGFASTENFAEHLTAKQKAAYKEKIGNLWSHKDYGEARSEKEAMETYKLALLTAQIIGEKDRVIAGILHHLAWLYRYQGNKEQEIRFLAFARDAYIRVFETERDALSNARLMYLVGELQRRLGNYHDAVKWFGRVINDKSIIDAGMIRASHEMWQTIREDMTNGGLELPEEMSENSV